MIFELTTTKAHTPSSLNLPSQVTDSQDGFFWQCAIRREWMQWECAFAFWDLSVSIGAFSSWFHQVVPQSCLSIAIVFAEHNWKRSPYSCLRRLQGLCSTNFMLALASSCALLLLVPWSCYRAYLVCACTLVMLASLPIYVQSLAQWRSLAKPW